MKLAISSVALMAGSVAAFGPFGAKAPAASTPVVKSFADDLVGALPPVGFWD
eukprot:CAMPEP_0197433810 /NCGR_PEP_ID=MMETSP1175-20131217/1622_1 /TAXON_ID=1003142 /ORGANISM="Triceratium dubium, Strain CCMP147" /LENGTH=51 /DNA_ID=CAMNT_0042962307 /DNA_START=32 /DNA_END=184 /DNA_ORIENTATION=+